MGDPNIKVHNPKWGVLTESRSGTTLHPTVLAGVPLAGVALVVPNRLTLWWLDCSTGGSPDAMHACNLVAEL